MLQVIRILSGEETLPDVASEESLALLAAIQDLVDDLPISHWSESAIHDAVAQWIEDHGCVPKVRDFALRGLPSHTTIKNRFGIDVKDFLQRYYKQNKCHSRGYGHRDPEEWLAFFREEYLRIQPMTALEYNVKRREATPTWATLAYINGVRTWRELLHAAKLNPPQIEYCVSMPQNDAIETNRSELSDQSAKLAREAIESQNELFAQVDALIAEHEKKPENFVLSGRIGQSRAANDTSRERIARLPADMKKPKLI